MHIPVASYPSSRHHDEAAKLANVAPNLVAQHDPYSLSFRCWPRMQGRFSSPQYNLGSTLHDLNTVDSRTGAEVDGINSDADGSAGPGAESLDNEEASHSEDCVHEGYGNSLQLQAVDGVDAEQQMNMENEENPRQLYGVLTYNDVIPIEAARARFLQLIIDRFIQPRFFQVTDPQETNFSNSNGKEKEHKRKNNDVHYEGDSRFLLPLTFVANLYETLISEIDARLHTVEGVHEKTMGVALEASGGLFRKLVKKYPKSGQPMSFKRREMASALEAKTKFPQLVRGDEKRVRFVVVHGLELVERPEMPPEDAEWFKRLTGRHEAAISARDYNFYSARVKHRRLSLRDSPTQMQQYQAVDPSTVQAQSPSRQHQLQLQPNRVRHPPSHPQTPPHVPQSHSGMNMMVVAPATPVKFCDECGAAYLRETSKFCSSCGAKRYGFH